MTEPIINLKSPWLWGAAGVVFLLTYGGRLTKNRKKPSGTRKNPRYPGELPGHVIEFPNPCQMPGNLIKPNPVMNGLMLSDGNTKVGYMWTWSITAGPMEAPWFGACPGSTEWCRNFCYAQKKHFIKSNVKNLYRMNFQQSRRVDFADRMIKTLRELPTGKALHAQKTEISEIGYPTMAPTKTIFPTYTGMGGSYQRVPWTNKYPINLGSPANPDYKNVLRIHVSGDMYDEKYIRDWIKIVKAMPGWRFYTYTRSWTIPRPVPLINELGKLPNITLMASTDPCTGKPPAHMREGAVGEAWSNRSIQQCRNLTKGEHCTQCRLCFLPTAKSNIVFPVHSLSGPEMAMHNKITAKAVAGWHMKGVVTPWDKDWVQHLKYE